MNKEGKKDGKAEKSRIKIFRIDIKVRATRCSLFITLEFYR